MTDAKNTLGGLQRAALWIPLGISQT